MSIAALIAHFESRDRAEADPLVRAQLALVRALADETERRPESSPGQTALRAQLGEELERLRCMLEDDVPERSGVYLRGRPTERADRAQLRRGGRS